MIAPKRFRVALGSLVIASCCMCPPVRAADPPNDPSDRFQVLLSDDFNGKTHLNWKPVRLDESHVSLTKNPGKLTITTQRGTIHGFELQDKFADGIQAKNIYVLDNPVGPDVDFVVTTCVSGFVPMHTYQQAGDDNYLKWGYEIDQDTLSEQRFVFVWETKGVPSHAPAPIESGLKRYWVRITKRGRSYEYSTSTDGKNFTVRGEEPWEGEPRMIGLLAKNGGDKAAPEIDAAFEYFEIKSPPPEAK